MTTPDKVEGCTNPDPCDICSDPKNSKELKKWFEENKDAECPRRRWDSPDCPCGTQDKKAK